MQVLVFRPALAVSATCIFDERVFPPDTANGLSVTPGRRVLR